MPLNPALARGLIKLTVQKLRAEFHPDDIVINLFIVREGKMTRNKTRFIVSDLVEYMKMAPYHQSYHCLRVQRESIVKGWKAYDKSCE